jgi:hypothetical protein
VPSGAVVGGTAGSYPHCIRIARKTVEEEEIAVGKRSRTKASKKRRQRIKEDRRNKKVGAGVLLHTKR